VAEGVLSRHHSYTEKTAADLLQLRQRREVEDFVNDREGAVNLGGI